jgi:hypothetical protein
MNALGEIALVVVGTGLVFLVFDSALRTFVLPRGSTTLLTRIVVVSLRRVFNLFARESRSYEQRDRVMALYAPLALLALILAWVTLVMVGYMFLFRAVATDTWRYAFKLSGSSLFTLGFVSPPDDIPSDILVFTEAAAGIALVALLISYLPTIYNAFSRREVLVARLSVRGGNPPSGTEILTRAQRMQRFNLLDELWLEWSTWFAELEETHTSLAILSFFRSPRHDRSWVTASGAVLDAASLYNSACAVPWSPNAGACVRGGYLALRAIADLFGIEYDPDPAPTEPISIARDEFDEACRALSEAHIPLKEDLDQAWRDFAGWRVNYDRVLLSLAGLTMAPYAPWSSDRSLRVHRRQFVRRGSRRPTAPS